MYHYSAIKKSESLASETNCCDITLLHAAVVFRRSRFVEFLISTDKSLVNKRDMRSYHSSDSSFTSLFSSSSESSDAPFALSVLPYEHVKNATPLHYACLSGDMDIAKMLLEAGADWEAKDYRSRTPEELISDGSEDAKDTYSRLRTVEEEKKKCEEEENKRKREEEEEKRRQEEEEEKEKKSEDETPNADESKKDDDECDRKSTNSHEGSEKGDDEKDENAPKVSMGESGMICLFKVVDWSFFSKKLYLLSRRESERSLSANAVQYVQ